MYPATQIATSADSGQTVAALTQQHVGLVHHVARQLARRLHDKVDLDELVSAGAVGLLQAAASYEPARGLTFSTYAVPRIRGSISSGKSVQFLQAIVSNVMDPIHPRGGLNSGWT